MILLQALADNSSITSTVGYLGMQWMDSEDFVKLVLRFLGNFTVIIILTRLIYYRIERKKEYFFTFMLISNIVFMMCFLLDNVKLELGFALGLFAIFGIIRYRTDSIPIKEMTYLFLCIGISVINALANKKVSFSELAFTNIVIVGVTYVLEYKWLTLHETSKIIIYEKIDLIKPENYQQLHDDLELRTGLNISRCEIGRIDFLRDTAQVKIYYFEKDQK